ncbi:MAG: YiiX/YebB-like N1pC/P60 family cysteine hydrolase [Candidatus Pseudomonas phytovorans]|uniref:YiiX/YebB-like N1pC/P60 family cysteine hydrolase n=1 Tax=Candidatus Pseudomonas phytovorans TaxID=3121377 RepID=A0AAJ6BCR1_9PSED|nr:YiiX/YebB-like N1pC/P60 family cysteine hydrolase [Pseudomonas sp.]WEK31552.1 MAG: YiiX/YebB-like N1pC/P60 family cysteine hydrolase [Pseudomonas sp.]
MMEKKYTIERSRLKPGDIILTAEKAAVSKGVRVGTGSRFSHAAIWVGGTMIEAVREGVFSKNAQRLMLDKPSHCAVLRSRKPLSDHELDQICYYAHSQVGSLYALDEAMLVLPRRLMKLESTKKQFCSRLVALAYTQIDYDFINLGSPHYCTPGKLARCKAFERVPGIVREVLPGEVDFAMSNDPVKKNAADTFEWLAKVRDLVESDLALKAVFDIQTISDVADLLIKRPQLDEIVVGFLHENDYLTYFNHDMQASPFRYQPDLMTLELRLADDLEGFIGQELGKEYSLAKRHTLNIDNSIQNYLSTGLSFVMEHLKLYQNLMNGVWIRLTNIAIACESVGMSEAAQGARELMLEIKEPLDRGQTVIENPHLGLPAKIALSRAMV